jgi:hypothetical protein
VKKVAKSRFRISKQFLSSGNCCVDNLEQWTGFQCAATGCCDTNLGRVQVVYWSRHIRTKKGPGVGNACFSTGSPNWRSPFRSSGTAAVFIALTFRLMSHGAWLHIVWWTVTVVSEKHSASLFAYHEDGGNNFDANKMAHPVKALNSDVNTHTQILLHFLLFSLKTLARVEATHVDYESSLPSGVDCRHAVVHSDEAG